MSHMTEPSTAPAERRLHPRIELMAQVRIKRSRTDYVLDIKNISLGGALVDFGSLKRPAWLELGKPVEMVIFVTGGADLTVAVTGRIVRVVEDEHFRGFGLQFDELDASASAAVEALVEHAKGTQPPPLPPRR